VRAGGPRRRLVRTITDDRRGDAVGGKLVLCDDEPVGLVTSAAWGATVGASVEPAYLRHSGPITTTWLADRKAEADIAGVKYSVALSLRAPLK
jgi:glycine cleavage system aminomethyltransferase T